MELPQRPTGALLLLSAFALLVAMGRTDPPWLLPAFLFLFVPGSLYLLGLLGTPAAVARLRRHPRAVRRRMPNPPTAPYEYRYGRRRARVALWIVGLTLVVLAVAVSPAVVQSIDRMSGAERLTWIGWGVAMALCIALLFLWIAMEARTRILATPSGLHLDSPLRHVEIPWDEVVALSATSLVLGGTPAGTRYRVYSPSKVIGFTGGLEAAEELATLIARATGLDWTAA